MPLAVCYALTTEIEERAALGIEGGVGPVRHPVVAHAPGDLPPDGQHLLHQGRWTVAAQVALSDLLVERPAGGREQVLAGSLGRIELGRADPELLRAGLGERSAAVGVG